MSEGHAKFSASGSKRWLACPGSIQLAEGLPKEPDSPYAAEGTRAHECLEFLLNVGPGEQLGGEAALRADGYPMQMVVHAAAAARWIWRQMPKGSELLAETRVHLDFVHEGMFGTTDAMIVDEFGELHVIDLKYGAGVAVDAENNTQGLYYGLGAAYPYDFNFERIRITILQPRAFHRLGPIRSWVVSPEYLKSWIAHFRAGVDRALAPNPPLVPGAHCRWCPAERVCPKVGNRSGNGAAARDFAG